MCDIDVLCADLGTKGLLFGPQSSHFLSFMRPTYWFVEIIMWSARTLKGMETPFRKTGKSFIFLLQKGCDCFCKVEVVHFFECLYVF